MIILIEFTLKIRRIIPFRKLLQTLAKEELNVLNNKKMLSIYIHIPFCRTRCGYCDFNTYAGCEHLIEDYVDAVLTEITRFSTRYSCDHPIHTIYFGGGTPTILPIGAFQKILGAINSHFQVFEHYRKRIRKDFLVKNAPK